MSADKRVDLANLNYLQRKLLELCHLCLDLYNIMYRLIL